MKTCTECLVSKAESEFNKNKSKPDGFQGRCRPCDNERSRSYYKVNHVRQRKQIKLAEAERRKQLQKWYCEYLSAHSCADCGEKDILVLEADHLSDKEGNISHMLASVVALRRFQAELEKCEIVCANCHRRRTALRLGGNYRSQWLEQHWHVA